MPNIVDRFGQLVDDAIPKPELARQLLLLGYRAKDVQLLLAPEKELTPARQYAAQIAMDAMIAPLAHPQRAALVNIFMPCELLHAFHLLPMFAEATACYLNGAAAERGFIHYAESAGISPTLCSYHKALLGMGLSGTAGKPLFTACTSIACDANNLTFRRLAQHYGIPHFYLDVPYDHDEYAVAEVSDRLREFAAFLEDATHQKLDEAALQQAGEDRQGHIGIVALPAGEQRQKAIAQRAAAAQGRNGGERHHPPQSHGRRGREEIRQQQVIHRCQRQIDNPQQHHQVEDQGDCQASLPFFQRLHQGFSTLTGSRSLPKRLFRPGHGNLPAHRHFLPQFWGRLCLLLFGRGPFLRLHHRFWPLRLLPLKFRFGRWGRCRRGFSLLQQLPVRPH